MSNTELFRRLAAALGRTEPWLFESDESTLRAAMSSGHPWLQGITYDRLWQDGHARLAVPDDWRPFVNGGFPTASGKTELYSDSLAAQGQDPLPWSGDVPQGVAPTTNDIAVVPATSSSRCTPPTHVSATSPTARRFAYGTGEATCRR